MADPHPCNSLLDLLCLHLFCCNNAERMPQLCTSQSSVPQHLSQQFLGRSRPLCPAPRRHGPPRPSSERRAASSQVGGAISYFPYAWVQQICMCSHQFRVTVYTYVKTRALSIHGFVYTQIDSFSLVILSLAKSACNLRDCTHSYCIPNLVGRCTCSNCQAENAGSSGGQSCMPKLEVHLASVAASLPGAFCCGRRVRISVKYLMLSGAHAHHACTTGLADS